MAKPRGILATSTPQAVAAGQEVYADGGNAADAALAAAAALTVTEPTGNGLGADAFGIVADASGGVFGLNASGRAPAAADAVQLRARGHTTMPVEGWDSVTVPGVVSGWCELHARFGRLPWARVLAPAIRLAREGFAVPPQIARQWQAGGEQRFGGRAGFEPFCATWLQEGTRAPAAGENFRNPMLADSLDCIARGGREAFYGELAQSIVAHSGATGGAFNMDDFSAHRADWVTPIAVPFRDATVFELPPNGQGLVASIALAIAAELPRAREESLLGGARVHRLAECLRLAIAEGHRAIADPACMRERVEDLLSVERISQLRARFRPDAALVDPDARPAAQHGTVYLAAADASGLVVSWIQSNYMGFGSGIVVPGTGISLQNRGAGFSLEPGHPNELAGGKRPFHTIIPGYYATKRARVAFGVMGGPMQPQGHVQMMSALLDHGLSPAEACAAPRFRVLDGREIALEPGFPPQTIADLTSRGHVIAEAPGRWAFGGAQIAQCGLDGTLDGGTDPRKDGLVGRA